MKGLKGKTVVVTGASSGIGEALARECAVQGANVVLGARSLQKLQLIVGDIRSKGGEATYCAVDVTKPVPQSDRHGRRGVRRVGCAHLQCGPFDAGTVR